MMKFTRALSTMFVVALALSACGKNDTLDKQSDQRSTVGPQLAGNWRSNCESQIINRLYFQGDRLIVERTVFQDVDCRFPERTIQHAGRFRLASNFKTGMPDSIIFSPDDGLTVTVYEKRTAAQYTNMLIDLKDLKDVPLPVDGTDAEIEAKKRENRRLAEIRLLTDFHPGQSKYLSRLVLEKLDDRGSNFPVVATFGNLKAIHYEVDNGHLQFKEGGDFAHVFVR